MLNFFKFLEKRMFYIIFSIILCLFFIYFAPHFLPHNTRTATSMCLGYGIFRIAPDFMIGYLSYLIIDCISEYKNNFLLWDVLATLSLFLFFLFSKLQFNRVFVVMAIVCLVVSLYQSKSFAKIFFGNPIFVFLGEISYSIYLLQFPFEILSNQFFSINFVSHESNITLFLLFLAHLLVLIVLGAISYRWLESPLRKKINEIRWLVFLSKMKCSLQFIFLKSRDRESF